MFIFAVIMKRVITQVQLRFGDFDMYGHLNNSSYLAYADLGKVEFFESLLGGVFDPAREGLVIAHIDVDFLAQTRVGESVQVITSCTGVGTTSLKLRQEISNGEGELKAVVNSVMVQFDLSTGVPAPVSEQWRELLS